VALAKQARADVVGQVDDEEAHLVYRNRFVAQNTLDPAANRAWRAKINPTHERIQASGEAGDGELTLTEHVIEDRHFREDEAEINLRQQRELEPALAVEDGIRLPQLEFALVEDDRFALRRERIRRWVRMARLVDQAKLPSRWLGD
jgi:hypothetical protein